jgi:transcription initiation factor TFIIB
MANVVTISKKVAKCPECGAKEVFKDDSRGELVCRKCGLVIEDQLMDFSQEWREFEGSGGGKPSSRTGAPISLSRHDKGISTEIGMGFTDIFKLPARKRPQFFRLKKWQQKKFEVRPCRVEKVCVFVETSL